MKNTIKLDDLLFGITKEDVQIRAMEKIGRRLMEDELKIAQKGLESGLTFDIDAIYSAIFDEMIERKEGHFI